jgi:hypothetical protein
MITGHDCLLERNGASEIDEGTRHRRDEYAVDHDDLVGQEWRGVQVASATLLATLRAVGGHVNQCEGNVPQVDSVECEGRHMTHRGVGMRCQRCGVRENAMSTDGVESGVVVAAQVRASAHGE